MPGELVRRPEPGSLEHYGVKGMKWGVQRRDGGGSGGSGGGIAKRINDYRHAPDASGVSRSQARSSKKRQNVETRRRLEDFESAPNRSNLIRAARNDRRSAQRTYEDIKREIKSDKSTGALGRNAARVALNRAKNERYENAYKADSKTMGEQFIEALFAPRTT